MDSIPQIISIKRQNGIAGQYAYDVAHQYEGEPVATVAFVGSIYGGPIVMVTPSGHQIPVSSRVTDRIGSTLTPEWCREFFSPALTTA